MIQDRINLLRKALISNKLEAYYFNTSDYHMSEYVPEYFKTIRYFSNFSGSLATFIVDKKKAYIFVDGRYHIQADKQCAPNGIEVIKLGTKGALSPEEFIIKNYSNKTIGLDGKRSSINFVLNLLEKGVKIKNIDIYSELIEDRTPLYDGPLYEIEEKYTGKSRKEKLKELKYCFKDKVHVINNLESIAYLLNLRSKDILYTPVFLSNLVVYDNDVYLFIDIKRLDPEQLEKLYLDGIVIKPYESFYDFLKTIKNKTVVLDKNNSNYETYISLENHNKLVFMRSIVEDMKAVKNEVEIKNSRLAHIYDGVCMVRFIKWLKETDLSKLTEKDAADYLDDLRLNYEAIDLSFSSIVSYNENAALCHYSPYENPAKLANKGILLVDSGGHYLEGTTDITRTISLGRTSKELKKHFTLVLKSMLNLSSAKFLNTIVSSNLDILTRINIWKEGLDYRHGTGHGVGHILSVHEAPPNINYATMKNKTTSECLKPGMIFSDEPGIYLEGKYGIRCENLLLVKEDETNEYGTFLSFETLTLCPFDLELIDKKYLDRSDVELLNKYHSTVYEKLSPYLNDDEKEFLKDITKAI